MSRVTYALLCLHPYPPNREREREKNEELSIPLCPDQCAILEPFNVSCEDESCMEITPIHELLKHFPSSNLSLSFLLPLFLCFSLSISLSL
jgi:hypothetical protein